MAADKMTKKDAERAEALCSLNRRKIEAWCRRNNVGFPADEKAFWLSVHRAISAMTDIDFEVWRRSALWLAGSGRGPITDRWEEAESETDNL